MRDNPGMTQEQARVAVDRDNLAASIQSGLIREDAREIVSKMTDEQVTALCPNGNPPAFDFFDLAPELPGHGLRLGKGTPVVSAVLVLAGELAAVASVAFREVDDEGFHGRTSPSTR